MEKVSKVSHEPQVLFFKYETDNFVSVPKGRNAVQGGCELGV